ncbi:MAG: CoA transferase, partial [Pseudomonadota bacterium]
TNALRVEHREALDGILVRVFAAASADEIAARCGRAGIAWGLARDVAGLSQHPALRRRAVALGNGRSVTLPTAPGAVGCAWADVPALGAQTEAIRAEFASAQDDPA